MQLREPGVCTVDVAAGTLLGASNKYTKSLLDLDGVYEDAAAYAALRASMCDAIVYEVTDYKPSLDAGDMILGVTRMLPGKVGREYFLTRGHIHANPNRPEMYYGE
jgi:glucose-6-phosphate isomerase